MKLRCLIFTAILEDCQISGIMMREILGNLAARGEKEKEKAREKDKEGERSNFFFLSRHCVTESKVMRCVCEETKIQPSRRAICV